jgi:photosystem II stability/assembly factor-like uncharacterized protein
MLDSLNGYGAGGNGLSIFWRTSDGGHTWLDIADTSLMSPGKPLYQSDAFFFIDTETGFFGGYNRLYKTVDGGASWVSINIPPDANPSTPEINGYSIHSICFSGSKYGWAGCWGLYGCVLKTTDAGETWQVANYHLGDVGSLNFCDSLHGCYIVYSNIPYLIFTSDNFFTNYSKHFSEPMNYLVSVYFQDDSTVWAGGGIPGVILNSKDGGLNYDTLNPSGFENTDFVAAEFRFFSNNGYAFGSHIFKYIDTLNASLPQKSGHHNTLVLWPNPANDVVTIVPDACQAEEMILTICTPEGVCLKREKRRLQNGRNRVSISTKELANGVYVIRVENNHRNQSAKFLILR